MLAQVAQPLVLAVVRGEELGVHGQEVVETAPESGVAERKEALDSDVDDLLDEIDDVLETNAEDFVKSFIQKGGQ